MPTLFKVLLQNPTPPTPPQEDSQSNTIWTGAFVPPFMQEASMRLIGQTQNARRRKRKMRNCLTHTTKCQKGNTIWQPDKWPIIHLLFFYDFFYFILFYFVVSTMKLHALAGRSKTHKKNKYRYGEVGCAKKSATQIGHHLPLLFHSLPPYPQSRPPYHHHPSRSSTQHKVQTVTTAACLRVTTLCRFIRSALSLFSFLIGQSLWHHLMVWHTVYALSGWSLFTCQSIRASCCGRSDSHEASASEWTHDRQS